jgi:DNA-binding beta-propeller fold protein YncE
MGRVFVTANRVPGRLYMLDPTQPAGSVVTVAGNLGGDPSGITFDGSRVWTANSAGSISIITPATSPPWQVTTVSSGFGSPGGIVFDGQTIWVTDLGLGSLLKLDSSGAVVQSIPIGLLPLFPAFDGENI